MVRLAPVPSPIWSPDGTSIAYASEGSLFVARTDGSGAHIVGTAPSGRATWSPDSSQLAYTVRIATDFLEVDVRRLEIAMHDADRVRR